jgi:hypothetical protein
LLFLDGNIVLFKSALAVLKMIRDDVQAVTDIEKINSIFEEATKRLTECNTLIYYLVLRRFGFDDNFLTKNRVSLNITTIENIMKNNEYKIQRLEQEQQDCNHKRRASYVKNSSLECFPDWPLCIYDLNYKYHIVEHLVFKVNDAPLVIENYFFDMVNNPRTPSFTKALRKKSKSSENNHKMAKMEKHHRDSLKTNKTEKFYDDDDENFHEQLDCYYNLLIERRSHCCNKSEDVSSTTSVIIDTDNSAFEQNEIENSFIEIKNSIYENSNGVL